MDENTAAHTQKISTMNAKQLNGCCYHQMWFRKNFHWKPHRCVCVRCMHRHTWLMEWCIVVPCLCCVFFVKSMLNIVRIWTLKIETDGRSLTLARRIEISRSEKTKRLDSSKWSEMGTHNKTNKSKDKERSRKGKRQHTRAALSHISSMVNIRNYFVSKEWSKCAEIC